MTHPHEKDERHFNYFDSIAAIATIIQSEDDAEKLLWNVCGKILDIFRCDRAWLLFPCDPQAKSWHVPIERTVPDYPGASSQGMQIEMAPDAAEIFATALSSNYPVVYGPGGLPLTENTKSFGVKSQLSMAIHPRSGQPWQFGIHQCAFERVWDAIEIKLFNIIGVMVGEALGNLLLVRHLQKEKEKLEQRVLARTSELTDLNKSMVYSEERYRCLAGAAFEGIVITEKGIILEANETCCQMLGYHPSELINKAATDFILPAEREKVKRKILSGYDLPYESISLRKDGSTFPIEVHGKMFSFKGRQVRVTAIRDISERKRAADLLLEREQLYRALFQKNSSVILLIDPASFAIFDANEAACAFYGYSKERLTGMKISDINILSEEDIAAEMARAKSVKKKYFTFRHRLADGTLRDVEVFSGPISVSGRSLLCSIIHDVSERKQVEQEREQLISKLQEALAEIKSLRGILPLCSYCKKIRDDKGYWEQVDVYIHKHSEADISHSICPECMKKYYPEYRELEGEES